MRWIFLNFGNLPLGQVHYTCNKQVVVIIFLKVLQQKKKQIRYSCNVYYREGEFKFTLLNKVAITNRPTRLHVTPPALSCSAVNILPLKLFTCHIFVVFLLLIILATSSK